MANPIVSIKNLSYKIENNSILKNISFEIRENSVWAFLGSNGAGKTTLVKCILNIIKPTSGKIVSPKEITYGYVPQSYNYSKSISFSGFDIIKQGLFTKKKLFTSKSDLEKVKKIAKLTDSASILNKKFNVLSGGEKQKILISRALISNPDILVLDEPLTGIDTNTEKQFIKLLQKIKEQGKIIILVLHDFEPFQKILTNAIVLKNGSISWNTDKIDNILHNKIFDSRHRHKHD